MNATITHVVGPEHTAKAVGSGALDVLGTPVLIAWLEEATCAALDVPEGSTSVGTRVDVEHLAASPVGATITAEASILHTDGRMVRLTVAARDAHGTVVGRGEIRRVIVDIERFVSRLPPV